MTTKKEVELGDPHYRTGEVEQSISGVWMKFSNKKEAFRSRLPIVCAIVPFSKSLDQLRICVHAFVQLRMRRLTMELEECECPIRNRLRAHDPSQCGEAMLVDVANRANLAKVFLKFHVFF